MQRAPITLLTVCGLEELEGHGTRGVTDVLSILDPGWPEPPFASYGEHRRKLLRFHDIVEDVPGQIAPQPEHVAEILEFGSRLGDEDAGAERHLLIHCHMGISRSTAAMLMFLAQSYPDETDDELTARLVAIRPQAWPNARMIGFADMALGRGGGLSSAVTRVHANLMAARPHLANVMRDLGRAREVDAALALAA